MRLRKLIRNADENIYTDAEAFRPERWFEGSDLVKEPSAFAPFSKGMFAAVQLASNFALFASSSPSILAIVCDENRADTRLPGPYNCIGKELALMNIRTTLTKMILAFDISFADGEDGTRFLQSMKSTFITGPGRLNLKFRRRTSS